MFGKLILILFCIYILMLGINDSLALYIHPRYTLFTITMSILGLVVLIGGLLLDKRNSHLNIDLEQLKPRRPWDIVVAIVLLLAFIVPPETLSSRTSSRRSVVTPQEALINDPAINCVEINGELELQTWVYILDEFPADCFKDISASVTGFIIESEYEPLPSGFTYVGRIVISCCVVDARPFALIVEMNKQTYPKDTWLRIEGKLNLRTIGGKPKFVISPDDIIPIETPKNGQYNYLDTLPTVTPLPNVKFTPLAP